MEITQFLPLKEWYRFDLEYWGLDCEFFASFELTFVLPFLGFRPSLLSVTELDFNELSSDPPLTAYHSLLLGKIGTSFSPSWFALDSSRGFESAGLKAFMRASVLLGEVAVYWSAVWTWIYWKEESSGSSTSRRGKVHSSRTISLDPRSRAHDLSFVLVAANQPSPLPPSTRSHPHRQRSLPIQLYHAGSHPLVARLPSKRTSRRTRLRRVRRQLELQADELVLRSCRGSLAGREVLELGSSRWVSFTSV